ncbi:Ethylene-responsive transcription factor ERF057 [Hondaea fermentalgiana]|uniref:Ethylene-responsive transcription factor ERF057 n=1 Tax=Hondaea fermentalgiana TaxID=2315210 RepID=A0A2R5GYD7_9STRA|nr:Ethylene-responsive transcription factor ERF057 [Hondaea fermentalgiana]|eukprot:GBG32994.1 Ethylene-responsive transcription factor ERF057 [Hondaea fermentalgiana]
MDLGTHDEFFDACFALGDHDGLMIDVTTKDLAFLDELSPFGDVPKPPVPALAGSYSGNADDQLASLRGAAQGSSGPPIPASLGASPSSASTNAASPTTDTKLKISSRKQIVPMSSSLLDGGVPPVPKTTGSHFSLPTSNTGFMAPRQQTSSSRRSSTTSGSGSISKAGRRKSSEFRGVSFNYKSQKWKSVITVNKVQKFLGYFDTEVAAAKKYDEASKKWRGNTGRLNFPDGIVPPAHQIPSKPPARHTVSKAVPHGNRSRQPQGQQSSPHLQQQQQGLQPSQSSQQQFLMHPQQLQQHLQMRQQNGHSPSFKTSSKSTTKIVPRHPYDFGPSLSHEDLGMLGNSYGTEVTGGMDTFAPVFPSSSFSPLISPFSSPMNSPRHTNNNNNNSYEGVKNVFSKLHAGASGDASSMGRLKKSNTSPTKRRPNLELQIPDANQESADDYGSPRKKQRPTATGADTSAAGSAAAAAAAAAAAPSDTKDHSRSSTSCPGVSYCKNSGRYRCDVNVNGMHSCVGFFDSETEAVRAYNKFAASAGQPPAKPDSPSDRTLSPKTADLVRKSRNLNISATPSASATTFF